MKQRRVLSGVLTVLLLLSGLTGCVSPNIREVRFGSVTARAHLREGKASYYEIELRKPLEPTAPRLLLQLPDGRVLDRTVFSYPALKRAGFMPPPSGDFDPSKNYSHELSRNGVSFFFNEGSIILMRISETTGPSVAIAGERAKIFRPLPLTQEDLEKMFGKPDNTAEGYQF